MSGQVIVLVEDSPEDTEATIRAFRKAGLANTVVPFESGEEAIEYVFSERRYKHRPHVSIGVILLDLNLPGIDGRDVLAQLKTHPIHRRIPVIVLSTSKDKRDIDRCYRDGANSYIAKPVGMGGFVDAIARMAEYWFEIAILPVEEVRDV